MKSIRKNPLFLAAITLVGFAFTAPAAFAVAFTLDADNATALAQDGSGTWEAAQPNWRDDTTSTDNQNWVSSNANSAKFGAGIDGTYAIAVNGAIQAGGGITFANSGYTLSGGTINFTAAAGNGPITVAAGKTATINSALTGANASSQPLVTINAGSVLNLGGNLSTAQYQFTGPGTLNITGGTSSVSVPRFNTAIMNHTGGSLTFSSSATSTIGYAAGRNVNYTVSGTGVLNLNNAATTATLAVGRNSGAFTAALTVKAGGAVNVGTTNAGLLALGIADANSNILLDVQDGTLTVGAFNANNKLVFFAAGASATKTATMTQSGGIVTANGIQFGNTAGTYDATSSANLQLSGGKLYVGALGITRGSAAAALPVTIQLSGGTLGASAAWSSSLPMKLGTAGGGVTIKAADDLDVPFDIALSGILSDDTAVNGPLTKTGAGTLTLSGPSTYSGATTITAGTLLLGGNNVLGDDTDVVIDAATLDAAFIDDVGTLDVTGAATIKLGAGTLSFEDSSAISWAGGGLNLTGTFAPGASLRFGLTNTGLDAAQLALITLDGVATTFILNGDGYLTVPVTETVPPLLTSIVDNKGGGSISTGTVVTYTVIFNEPMKISSIGVGDFGNDGDATVTIDTVTAVSSSIFSVRVTPSTTGTLRLKVNAGAVLEDAVGNDLVTSPLITDDTLISVNNTPAPTLLGSDIVDDKAGGPVVVNTVDTLVNYTVTFSEDMDNTSVSAADFGNEGTAAFTIGTVTETAPGVFSVPVLPTSGGTLQLKVNANAVLRAATGNVMDLDLAILDDTIITITINDSFVWDTISNGAPIDAASGDWNTDLGNAVWNNIGINEVWTQTSITDGNHNAVFAGVDGTLNQYVVTLASQIAAKAISFDNSGYQVTGSILALLPTPASNGGITVATGKIATIDSTILYAHNTPAAVSVSSGGILNLGGGTSGTNRPQWTFAGAGTINFTAGDFSNTIGSLNAASINLTGGTHTMTDSSNVVTYIGNGAGQDVNYTVSGGTLSALGFNDASTGYAIALGSNTGIYKSTLTVKDAGIVNIGTTTNRTGQLNIGSNNFNANALLDVQGGSLTVGTGKSTNKILFFAAGADANKTATMTQSGGTVTANGIQFGASTGGANINGAGSNGTNTYDATSSATLNLSGGTLYVGGLGITRGTAAAALPITIQLSGGTLGASEADWASSLDIALGTAGGGVTIQAADSVGTAYNISLSGSLSDVGGFTKTGDGTLTLAGANTYSGNTTVTTGTLILSNAPDPLNANTGNDGSTVTIAATGATLDLTYTGTDRVDKLFIGATQLAAGTYGPSATPQAGISGTGTLTVLSGPSAGYSSWALINGASAINLNEDQDNDGVANGIEYFIGGPTLPTANTTGFTSLPSVINNTVTWTKATAYAGVYGTHFVVETSTTLTGVWGTAALGAGANQVVVTGNTVIYTFPVGTINFARLKVTGP